MPRIARIVAPGYPHHVVQRGNRRQKTFFCEQDYRAYLELLIQWCAKCSVEIWAYCLMPNHVHFAAVPRTSQGLRQAFAETHRRYTRMINFREGWRGHLWQGRFWSSPMNERYLLATARYIELNPVVDGLASSPEEYRWSSAAAHLSGSDDGVVRSAPLLEIVPQWREFLAAPASQDETERILSSERTGRPLGDEGFISELERISGRVLKKKPAGRKPKAEPPCHCPRCLPPPDAGQSVPRFPEE
jgi:putative transposase